MTFAVCAMAFAASVFPAGAQEPTAAGLWQIVEKGKPAGWVLFLDRDGVYEGILAKTIPQPGDDPNEVCGKCTDDRKNAPYLGIPFVRDMKRDGLKYEGGNILDMRDGQIWKAKMAVSPDGQVLTLRGYLGVSLFGQDRTWTRLPDTAMAQLDPAIIAKYLPAQAAALAAANKPPAGAGKAPVATKKSAPLPAQPK